VLKLAFAGFETPMIKVALALPPELVAVITRELATAEELTCPVIAPVEELRVTPPGRVPTNA
jgi:hypothetical protein